LHAKYTYGNLKKFMLRGCKKNVLAQYYCISVAQTKNNKPDA
jgi:hypothetical protein